MPPCGVPNPGTSPADGRHTTHHLHDALHTLHIANEQAREKTACHEKDSWQGNRNKLHWAARGSPSPHRAALGSTGTQHIQLAYFDCLFQALLELSLVCSRRGVGEGGTTEIRQSRTAARLNSSASHTLIKAGEVQ